VEDSFILRRRSQGDNNVEYQSLNIELIAWISLKDKQMSLHGTVHSIASNLGVVASVIGSIWISINFAHSESTQSLAFNMLIIAIAALIWAVFLWLGLLGDLALKYQHNVSSIILSFHNLTGLTERLLLGISVLWLMIIVNWIIK